MAMLTISVEIDERQTNIGDITRAVNALAEMMGGKAFYGGHQDEGATFVIKQPAAQPVH